MSFADDIKKFASETSEKIKKMENVQKEKLDELLKELLGDDTKLITSINFDNERQKFFDVKAPASVIEKLHKAGYLRE